MIRKIAQKSREKFLGKGASFVKNQCWGRVWSMVYLKSWKKKSLWKEHWCEYEQKEVESRSWGLCIGQLVWTWGSQSLNNFCFRRMDKAAIKSTGWRKKLEVGNLCGTFQSWEDFCYLCTEKKPQRWMSLVPGKTCEGFRVGRAWRWAAVARSRRGQGTGSEGCPGYVLNGLWGSKGERSG